MRWLGLAVALIIVAIIATLGLARWKATRVDQPAFIAVTATWPGASADSMEHEVAEQLERALSQIPNMRRIRTESRESVTTVFLEVLHAPIEDEFFVVQRVQQSVAGIQNTLPQDVSPPTVQRLPAPGQHATFRWLIESDSMPAIELTKWAKEVFRRKLEVQAGVRSVGFCGTLDGELSVELDLQRLQAANVAPSAVIQAIQSASLELPSGALRNGSTQFTVRTLGRLRLSDVEELSLGQVKLRDVAVVRIGAERDRDCIAYMQGRAVIVAEVTTFATLEKPLELPTSEAPPGVTMRKFEAKNTFTFDAQASEERLASQLSGLSGVVMMKGAEVVWLTDEASPRAASDLPGIALRTAPGGVTVSWFGPDRSVLRDVATKGRAKLAATNAAWVGTVWPPLSAAKQLDLDRERIVRFRIERAEVLELIRLITSRVHAGALESGESVNVRIPEVSLENLLTVRTREGIPLSELITIEVKEQDASLFRLDRERAMQVRVGLDADAARKALEGESLPPGVRVVVE